MLFGMSGMSMNVLNYNSQSGISTHDFTAKVIHHFNLSVFKSLKESISRSLMTVSWKF